MRASEQQNVSVSLPHQASAQLAEAYVEAGWWTEKPLWSFVEELAARDPGRTAMVSNGVRHSWQEYWEQAARLAQLLESAGVEPGARVVVLLPDGFVLHSVYIALSLVGAVTVGVGMRTGLREIEAALEKTQATVLISEGEYRGTRLNDVFAPAARAESVRRSFISIEMDDQGGIDQIAVNGEVVSLGRYELEKEFRDALGPDDLFLINTTSGTTGLPKYVLHTQNRWFYFHQAALSTGQLTPDEVILSVVPMPFGFGLWTSHVTPTLLGATLVTWSRFEPGRILETIVAEGVTVLAAVSSQLRLLLKHPGLAQLRRSKLRVAYTGGEAVPADTISAFEEATACKVLQFYGSNESGLVTGTRLSDPDEKRRTTAGRVIEGTELRLYDGAGQVVPGRRGQPASRGPACSLGYLDDDDANSELFTEDGFILHGDLAEVDDEGYLKVIGRTADIIIRGGKNISAAAVEEVVGLHPEVELVAALPEPDELLGERTCVFVQLKGSATLELADLLDFLDGTGVSKTLYPEKLVVLDALPIAPGGKIAKGELRKVQQQAGSRREPDGVRDRSSYR